MHELGKVILDTSFNTLNGWVKWSLKQGLTHANPSHGQHFLWMKSQFTLLTEGTQSFSWKEDDNAFGSIKPLHPGHTSVTPTFLCWTKWQIVHAERLMMPYLYSNLLWKSCRTCSDVLKLSFFCLFLQFSFPCYHCLLGGTVLDIMEFVVVVIVDLHLMWSLVDCFRSRKFGVIREDAWGRTRIDRYCCYSWDLGGGIWQRTHWIGSLIGSRTNYCSRDFFFSLIFVCNTRAARLPVKPVPPVPYSTYVQSFALPWQIFLYCTVRTYIATSTFPDKPRTPYVPPVCCWRGHAAARAVPHCTVRYSTVRTVLDVVVQYIRWQSQ